MNSVFLKMAFRNIQKSRLNSIINFLGFSIGIGACLFIFLFVEHERNFDNFYPNQDRLFRIIGESQNNDNASRSAYSWMPVAADMKAEIAGIENFCRVTSEHTEKIYWKKAVFQIKKLRFADENFFPFFNFKLLIGNPLTVLNSADKIVLTRAEATRIFGTTDVIGKPMTYQHHLFTVSGIAENSPSNTHLDFDALISNHFIEQDDNIWKDWGGGISYLSYLELDKGVGPQQIEQALPKFLEDKINRRWREFGWKFSASLQKIDAIHLADGSIQYDCSSNRNMESIYVVGSICLLILLLAMVNYIVLYSSQKMARRKDVGILKMHGAGQRMVYFQTYLEVFVLSTASCVFSVFMLHLALPFLNDQLSTSVTIGENIGPILVFLVMILLAVSLLVTFFSTRSLVFSRSVDILKNEFSSCRGHNLEGKLLLSFQFTVVILLLVALFTISRQNRFLLNKELGFDKERIITVEAEEEFLKNELSVFKQDLQRLADVQSVSLSSQTVGRGLTMNGYRIDGEESSTMIKALYADADFLSCFGVHLVEGRNFSNNPKRDQNAVLINQKLADRAGWENPLNKTINRNGDLEVIGVVADFNFETLQHQVQPMLIMSNPAWDGWGYSTVNIRFQTSDIQGLIHQIDRLWTDRFPETPFKVSFLDDQLAQNYQSFQVQQKLIGFFSLLAILISGIGLFGVTVFTTRLRNKEIGIRKVNGARISEVMIMLNRDFIKWVMIAFVIATPMAWYAMNRWLENFAYKTMLSWWIFALAGLLALGIALITVSWQSWKAATRNPMEALRYE